MTQGGNVRPALADDQGPSRTFATPSPVAAPPAVLSADDLLGADQVTRLAAKRDWTEGRTSDNSSGTGMVVPCRQARNADPGGGETLMRRFSAAEEKGEPALSAVQISELSVSESAARTTFDTAVNWYAGCLDRRMQLLSTHRVDKVGDEAVLSCSARGRHRSPRSWSGSRAPAG